jgi:hypothetical protein
MPASGMSADWLEKSMSNSTSDPIRNTRYRGRAQSLSTAGPGRRIAGRPSPIRNGAIAICRRSSSPASRNADTVTPPPSMNTRAQPRPCRRRNNAARSTPAFPDSSPTMLASPNVVSPSSTRVRSQTYQVGAAPSRKT